MNGQTFTYNPGLEYNTQTFFLPLSYFTSDWIIITAAKNLQNDIDIETNW